MKKLQPFNRFTFLFIIALFTGTSFASAQCIGPNLVFQNPGLVSGIHGQPGATYKFSNVTYDTDAYIQIDSLVGGATLLEMDATNTGFQHAWQPLVGGPSHILDHHFYIRWTITFKATGTNTIISVPCLNLSAMGVEQDNIKIQVVVETYNSNKQTIAANSEITVNHTYTTAGKHTQALGFHVNDRKNIDTTAFETQITFEYGTASSVVLKTGIFVNKTSSPASMEQRYFSFYYKSLINLSTLPVRLLSFTGRAINSNSVEIKWVTELEINNKQFEIQRSFNGKDFETVALAFSLEGTGTKAYKLTDKIPDGSPSKVYYRIKQIDIDDKYSISKIITISLEESNNTFVKLSPNPVDNEFTISLENNTTPVMSIRIVDMSGREIFRKSMVGLNNNIHQLDARQANMHKPGMYVAELLFTDGSRSTQKMIKR